MSAPVVTVIRQEPLPSLPTYVAKCCREWDAPVGFSGGRCGLCGEVPTFLRAGVSSR